MDAGMKVVGNPAEILTINGCCLCKDAFGLPTPRELLICQRQVNIRRRSFAALGLDQNAPLESRNYKRHANGWDLCQSAGLGD